MRTIGKPGWPWDSRVLIVVVGCVAIIAMLFLASWMNTRCWNSGQACSDPDTAQR